MPKLYIFCAITLITASIYICPSPCLAAIEDLVNTIYSPNAGISTGWGGELVPVTDTTILVGRAGNHSDNDGPVRLIDITSGQTLRSYHEPGYYTDNSDLFGYSIAYTSSHVLIGAYATDLPGSTGSDAGVVHVYDAATGLYLRTIDNPNPSSSGSFSVTMAPLGDNVVVGTYKDQSSNGAAYLIDPSTGGVIRKFENPTGNQFDNFGSTVAVSGSDILIGSRNGGVVYRYDSQNGQLIQTYEPPPGNTTPLFGFRILPAGDRLVIGNFQDSLSAVRSGAVYVYDMDSGGLLSTLTSPTPTSNDWFGYDLALLDANTLAVSEIFDDATGQSLGSVQVFDLNTGDHLADIQHPVPGDNGLGRFGEAIASVGGALVVGSTRDLNDVGKVYVYEGLIPEPGSVLLFVLGSTALSTRYCNRNIMLAEFV